MARHVRLLHRRELDRERLHQRVAGLQEGRLYEDMRTASGATEMKNFFQTFQKVDTETVQFW